MINAPLLVLLTEDDPDEKEIFNFFLGQRNDLQLLGFFDSGIHLIHHLESLAPGTENIDLIFLDHNMPLVTGFQVLQKLKDSPRFARIPVVIFSTYVDPALETQCKQAGALAVFNKPMNSTGYNAMIDEIKMLLGRL